MQGPILVSQASGENGQQMRGQSAQHMRSLLEAAKRIDLGMRSHEKQRKPSKTKQNPMKMS